MERTAAKSIKILFGIYLIRYLMSVLYRSVGLNGEEIRKCRLQNNCLISTDEFTRCRYVSERVKVCHILIIIKRWENI